MKIKAFYTINTVVTLDVDDKFQPLATDSPDYDDALMEELLRTLDKMKRDKAIYGEPFPNVTWGDVADLEAVWDENCDISILEL